MSDTLEDTKTISVKLSTEAMTNTIVKEANLLIVAMPLNTPKYVALGFLYSVLSEMGTFYEACEQAAKQRKPGIIKAGVDFGKNLLKS
jgi:hypothetical protein